MTIFCALLEKRSMELRVELGEAVLSLSFVVQFSLDMGDEILNIVREIFRGNIVFMPRFKNRNYRNASVGTIIQDRRGEIGNANIPRIDYFSGVHRVICAPKINNGTRIKYG